MVPTICVSITSVLTNQILLKSGEIEINPGPKKSSAINLCYWNLNGLAAYEFLKVLLIEAFIAAHNIDVVCLPETFLYSTIPHNDKNININGFIIKS